jgi:uncharacterized protein YdaU (DUF1376 family)
LTRSYVWWIDRYRKSTAYTRMTLAEQGAYKNLIDELVLRGGVIENDNAILGAVCGRPREWNRVKKNVLLRFVLTPEGWRHPTVDALQKAADLHAKRQGRYRAKTESDAPRDAASDAPRARHVTRPPNSECLIPTSSLRSEDPPPPNGESVTRPEDLAALWRTHCPTLAQPAAPLAHGVRKKLGIAIKREKGRDWEATFRRVGASPKLRGEEFDWCCPGILWAVGPENLANLDAGQHDPKVTTPKPRQSFGYERRVGGMTDTEAALTVEKIKRESTFAPEPAHEPEGGTPW